MSELLEDLRAALAGRYDVEAPIGRGGMATVFVADDLKHGRRVAIKVLTPELASSLGADRFLREIHIAARLSHPHILPLLDSGQAGTLLYYVMPFVEGESLRQRLQREQQLSIDDAVHIAIEVADALSYAHGMGIVHRDIKPENVLLQGGHAVVADFGIARMIYEDQGPHGLTKTGVSIGTASYMSPEQFAGTEVDGRADEYSLACMVYEMLVGQVPFTGPNAMAIMSRHTLEAVPSIRVVRQTVPDELEGVILRALEKTPADRFATIQEFKDALLDGAAGSSFAPRTTRYSVARMTRAQGRIGWFPRRWRWAVAAGLALVLGAGAYTRYYIVHPVARVDVEKLKHVAVLYFDDQSKDGSLRYLADGLSEAVMEGLSRVNELKVISRNGVRPFRGVDASALPRVADSLEVGSVVLGSVAPTKEGAHVEVRLYDGPSGVSLNEKSFDFAMTDVGRMRDTVAMQVSEFLRSQIGQNLRVREGRASTSNNEAWLLSQRAERRRKDADSLFAAGKVDEGLGALTSADSLLAGASQLDAAWPRARTLRASVAFQRARALAAKPPAAAPAIDSGIAFADSALAIDARDQDALEVRGQLQYQKFTLHLIPKPEDADRVLRQAENDLNAAVQLNSNQAGAWATLSQLYYQRQNLEQANAAALRAYESDAYLANSAVILNRLFWTSHDLQSFQSADRWCKVGHERFPKNPNFVLCQLWMRITPYYEPADPAAAWRLLDTLQAVTPATAWPTTGAVGQIVVAGVLAKASHADSARRVLLRARPAPGVDPRHELAGYEAVVRVILGDYDEAVSLIETYLSANPEHRRGFATNRAWWWADPKLQNHPRFKAIVATAR